MVAVSAPGFPIQQLCDPGQAISLSVLCCPCLKTKGDDCLLALCDVPQPDFLGELWVRTLDLPLSLPSFVRVLASWSWAAL